MIDVTCNPAKERPTNDPPQTHIAAAKAPSKLAQHKQSNQAYQALPPKPNGSLYPQTIAQHIRGTTKPQPSAPTARPPSPSPTQYKPVSPPSAARRRRRRPRQQDARSTKTAKGRTTRRLARSACMVPCPLLDARRDGACFGPRLATCALRW
ncbi:hypothetical protein EJ06DRAFT_532080 [Trichodelitschia bisporula]|uniref:Uncharacterized protein n=1 Tax=Trichodelitschia bisporula TaxID=703511 RepID=A0A6G1HR61_9PEZI|nr:hypothetical protein EJ06DRAFT_532080 [Trichodelitschia bisporula]